MNPNYPSKSTTKDELVGDYLADILVDKTVVLELKAAESIVTEHETQLINYLRATRYEVGLLLNFGKTPEVRGRFSQMIGSQLATVEPIIEH